MISIVCVNNNEEILNDYLLKSLKYQASDYELIIVDNTKGVFKSAAKALNNGGRKAKGKYIMFVHNDVSLLSCKWLDETEKMLDTLINLGIAGVAGKQNSKGTMTNSTHGNPQRLAGEISVQEPIKVQTLDECLVIIPRSVFNVLQFDEETCDDWHLYAVDYSLSLKKLNLEAYVLPSSIYHRSSGYSMSENYYCILRKLLIKHRSNYRIIYTTMGNWIATYPLILQKKGIRPLYLLVIVICSILLILFLYFIVNVYPIGIIS